MKMFFVFLGLIFSSGKVNAHQYSIYVKEILKSEALLVSKRHRSGLNGYWIIEDCKAEQDEYKRSYMTILNGKIQVTRDTYGDRDCKIKDLTMIYDFYLDDVKATYDKNNIPSYIKVKAFFSRTPVIYIHNKKTLGHMKKTMFQTPKKVGYFHGLYDYKVFYIIEDYFKEIEEEPLNLNIMNIRFTGFTIMGLNHIFPGLEKTEATRLTEEQALLIGGH